MILYFMAAQMAPSTKVTITSQNTCDVEVILHFM